ncbi:hypothetical protein [Clostridium thermarum]|uniref:hypothetical protein n=1 Tax=Clostridium thermarum TaxID=1716543 RepID=UPI0013CFB4EE|nr:hypothetical protein [Clostridium thermarum]
MGDYLRVFCTKEDVPTINEIFKWTKLQGYNLRVDKSYVEVDPAKPWEEVAVIGEDGNRVFIAEVNRDGNEEESLMREEVNEFMELIKELEDVPAENLAKVRKHLNHTKYVVAVQITGDDLGEEGDNAVSIFLQYFVVNCGGMVQEDGEGFYEGNKIIVEME